MSTLSERAWLMREVAKIASALGETFAPFCEIVLHDLSDPEHAIIQIENNLSGRMVGDGATELGLARMSDSSMPEIIANYANAFEDGRAVKSTSIGIKDMDGKFIAALCINMDISYLRSINAYLSEFTRIKEAAAPVSEVLTHRGKQDVSSKIIAFAAARNRDPRALTTDEKREILSQLADEGELDRRGVAETIAGIFGITRSNVYYYLRKARKKEFGENDDADLQMKSE